MSCSGQVHGHVAGHSVYGTLASSLFDDCHFALTTAFPHYCHTFSLVKHAGCGRGRIYPIASESLQRAAAQPPHCIASIQNSASIWHSLYLPHFARTPINDILMTLPAAPPAANETLSPAPMPELRGAILVYISFLRFSSSEVQTGGVNRRLRDYYFW